MILPPEHLQTLSLPHPRAPGLTAPSLGLLDSAGHPAIFPNAPLINITLGLKKNSLMNPCCIWPKLQHPHPEQQQLISMKHE